MKNLKVIGLSAVLIIASFTAKAKEITVEEFQKLSPKQAIELAQSWHRKGIASVAVTPTEIQASLPGGKQASIALGDEFYVSVAPYVKRTHECDYHVPTGCTGEMIDAKMHLKITDEKTGEVIKDEDVQIQQDGFLDLWLPRNKKFIVEFTYKGKKAKEVLGTSEKDRTCVTTMKLK